MAGSSGTAELADSVSVCVHAATTLTFMGNSCCNKETRIVFMGISSGFNPVSAVFSFRRCVPPLVSAASLLCIAAMPPAQATTYVPAFTFKTTTTTVDGGPTLLGYRFSTDMDKVIKGIGVYKEVTSPPNRSLGIWNFADPLNPILLFQTVITTAGDCADDFCWYPASALTGLPEIKKETPYAIATVWGSEPVPARIKTEDITILSPGFNVGSSAFNFDERPLALDVNLSPFELAPTGTGAEEKSYFTANLSFETSGSVQIPSPLPLMGAAAAFGWSRKIRRRISPAS